MKKPAPSDDDAGVVFSGGLCREQQGRRRRLVRRAGRQFVHDGLGYALCRPRQLSTAQPEPFKGQPGVARAVFAHLGHQGLQPVCAWHLGRCMTLPVHP